MQTPKTTATPSPAALELRARVRDVIEAEAALRSWRPMSSAPVPIDRARRSLALELAIRACAEAIAAMSAGRDGIHAINAKAGRMNALARLDAGRHFEAAVEIKAAATQAMLADYVIDAIDRALKAGIDASVERFFQENDAFEK